MGVFSPVAVLVPAVVGTWLERRHRHGATGRAGSVGR